MEQADSKNEKETQDNKYGDAQDDGSNGELLDNKNDAGLKDDNKDGERQDSKNYGLIQGDKKNDAVMQEYKKNGEKPDNKTVLGQQEGFENETQKQEDNEKDAKASTKLESSEQGTSTLLKPKRILVKKSQSIKLKTRKKKPQVNAGKDGVGSAKNMYAGEEIRQKQISDEHPLEDLQAESNNVKDKRKRTIEDEPPLKTMDTEEQNKQKKPQIGKGKDGGGYAKKMELGEGSEQKIKNDEQTPRKNLLAEMNGGEDAQKRTTGGEPCVKKKVSPWLKNKGKARKLEKGQKKQKIGVKHRKSREAVENQRYKAMNDERGKSLTNMKKDRHDDKGKRQINYKRKEKLGGLIFMCNGKTKPDCFGYRVMGVSQSKKDIVMDVKPGIKLFLFDFDLKLLHGIYIASSRGGVKLEPKAFGGAFPFQVRFTIDTDYIPLPESVFKKAIKDNYDEKNKFKTELTIRQVRKLKKLFRSSGRPPLQLAHLPPRKTARDNDLQGSSRIARANSRRDEPGRDNYGNADLKSYSILSQDSDQRLSYRDTTLVQREEIPRDLLLAEKEYRAYGLQGERRNVTPPLAKPTREIYRRDYGRENHRNHLEYNHKESVPPRLETRHTDAFYLNDNDYRTHGRRTVVSDYTDIPYYPYGTSSEDPLLHHLRREDVGSRSYGRMMIEADDLGRIGTVGERLYSRDNLGRRENVRESLYSTDKLGRSEAIENRLYSGYATGALTDRSQSAHSHRTLHEEASLPVSSRYSFGGPSYTYR